MEKVGEEIAKRSDKEIGMKKEKKRARERATETQRTMEAVGKERKWQKDQI